jgi:hypothetical protein
MEKTERRTASRADGAGTDRDDDDCLEGRSPKRRPKTSLQTASGQGKRLGVGRCGLCECVAFVLPWQLNVSDRGDGVRCPGMDG